MFTRVSRLLSTVVTVGAASRMTAANTLVARMALMDTSKIARRLEVITVCYRECGEGVKIYQSDLGAEESRVRPATREVDAIQPDARGV